jgi:PAS domain S-box-containing protein
LGEELAMQESATNYRTLLESLDEGFCICEMLFGKDGKPIDYRFLEVNSIFGSLTGLEAATGKTARELVPNLEAYWIDIYGKVVLTGEAVRFEQQAIAMNRWFDVHAFAIGEPGANQFAILFTNITEAKRIENERKKVEQERERFLAVGSDLQVITGINGYFQWVSPTFERTLGWTIEEMTSRPWTDFVHPDDTPKSISEINSLFSGNRTIAFENRYLHKDGSYRWFLWNAQPYPEEQVVYGVAVDISDRKRAELNTKFLANITQELLQATSVEEILQTIGEQLKRYLNISICAFVEINQGAQQAVINHNWHQNNVPSLVGFYSLREFVTDEFMHIAQSGKPIVIRDIAVDPRIADPQRYVALNIGAEIHIPLIRDGRWKFSFAVFYQTPYNWCEDEIELMGELANRIWAQLERAHAEAALRESRTELERQLKKFNAVVSALPDFIYTFDLSGQFIDASKPLLDLLQKTLTQVIGKNFFELDYPVDLAERLQKQIQEVIETRQSLKDETPFTNAFEQRVYEYIFVPIFNAQGEVEMVAGVSRDITEHKEAEAKREKLLQQEQAAREAAEQANRIKDEFLAVLSHELRSPLNPILGWTKLLQSAKLDPTRQAEALATIERNARLQAQLIEDLLDISRIMQGKLSLNAAAVNLTFVISAAVETVRLAAEAKNIQVALDFDSTDTSITGDATRLQQVVWNLLTNAVKFTPQGGQVTVELRQIDTLSQIRVIDSGKGINPQFLPYVFEYFRQEDGSTTRKFGGLGLGLAIVRQIVEMHGGTVRAESAGENQGATFTVQLPAMQQLTLSMTEPINAQTGTETPLENVKILLVDDDTDTREFQAFLLEQNGAKVTAVASGLEVLQALDRFIPDVLVSDVGMAQMNGYMLIQEIRSRPPARGGTIPAIAVTAYAGEIDSKQAVLAGFQRHVSKPVDSVNLIETILSLVRCDI